ncbi:MAG: TOTE conflict system archaeo-eukaryotic primase domain-containing protein, partial [Solirubrobacteraceae bacterium]
MSLNEDLDAAIAAAEAGLRELDRQREATARALTELRARRAPVSSSEAVLAVLGESSSWTPERKLALFASLFRGREDVFPLRWEKPANGRSGWAPCCENEWKTGVCGKPRVKCGECPNQAFRASTENELRKHLQGRGVMGVYPLLADDSCRLLVIDLDGRSWRADVAAIREACRELDAAPAVERSRSGDGAHVWFFFSEPVPAALARRFGSMLLTDAMARTPTLGMNSYDRLFPSQDTLPKGGFGNLIALPLQQRARLDGNTLFLDERLEPFEDQWSYLQSLPRITPKRLLELVSRGADEVGLLEMSGEAREDESPWRRAPPLAQRLTEAKLPSVVSATLAQRLYVRSEAVPAALLDAMRRLAAFANPKFFELQAMRKSTARTPRVIACYEQTSRFLVLPRGCREPLAKLLAGLDIALELADERVDGEPLETRFVGELSARQEEAVPAMLSHELGLLCAPPGIGKTVIAARLIAARGRSTLVLVHRKPLLEQWVKRLDEFLDLDAGAIGTIGGGRGKPTGRVDVAMVQSLARNRKLDELLAGYGHVVVDECHHVPAVTTERVLQAAPARYVTGLTATPKRRDGHQPIIAMQCGPVRHTIEPSARRSSQPLALRVIRRETSFDPQTLPTDASIQEVFTALATDEQRTEMIANDTLKLAAQGRCPIVITERREHLQRLAARLAESAQTLITLHGEMRTAEHRAAHERLARREDDGGRIVLATGRYIGEGFDDPRLDTLLLAMPIAWKGTVIQYA